MFPPFTDVPGQDERCRLCAGKIAEGEQALYLASFDVWWHLACLAVVRREIREKEA